MKKRAQEREDEDEDEDEDEEDEDKEGDKRTDTNPNALHASAAMTHSSLLRPKMPTKSPFTSPSPPVIDVAMRLKRPRANRGRTERREHEVS